MISTIRGIKERKKEERGESWKTKRGPPITAVKSRKWLKTRVGRERGKSRKNGGEKKKKKHGRGRAKMQFKANSVRQRGKKKGRPGEKRFSS